MEKGFFKVFFSKSSAEQLKIPTSFIDFKNGKLPRKVSLRDRFDNMWPIEVTKTDGNFYFHYGWEKFVEDNTVELGDFFIFDYDGKGTFDLKLLGIDGCEKKEVGGKKKKEKMNIEHQKNVELKRKNLASDSSSSSSGDDSDEDYMVKEEDAHEEYEVVVEEEEEKEEEQETEKTPLSKRRCMKGEEEVDDDDDEDEEEEEKEEENEMVGTFKKTAPRSKVECKRATACKVRNRHDQFGADIFRSGRAIQPKNPYFVAKMREERKDELYIPIDVVRDYKLELPSRITIRDSVGREFETKLKKWKDGRIWLTGGWRSLCRWNLVRKNDSCICEFVRGKGKKELYLQVQVLHEGESSRPNKINEK